MSGFELGNDGPLVILTAVDGSRTSMRAGAYAAGLARRQRARLVVVYVNGGGAVGGLAGLSPGSAAALTVSAREFGERLHEESVRVAEQLGMPPFDFVNATGDPYTEIVRIAAERRADTVVIGASEFPAHRLVGSLAVRLVRAGLWPVTVVP